MLQRELNCLPTNSTASAESDATIQWLTTCSMAAAELGQLTTYSKEYTAAAREELQIFGDRSPRQPSAGFATPIGKSLEQRILLGETDIGKAAGADVGIQMQFLDTSRMNAGAVSSCSCW
ncbi:hypothetical protein [Mycobacterium neglectum]|uniref:hypothetical protein n=1 Tax=Mycobacterium neglectum TaxID=242737 RepID=UPI00159BD2F9|nr:hypothetical protein [Mycobacterium neglectum]